MMMDRKTISLMKECELVGVSRRTIYNWIAAGKVEYVRTAGGSIRIFTDSLWRQPDGLRISSPTSAAEQLGESGARSISAPQTLLCRTMPDDLVRPAAAGDLDTLF